MGHSSNETAVLQNMISCNATHDFQEYFAEMPNI